jgi:Trypsin-co-occurring domain 2
MSEVRVPLAEAVKALRAELLEAIREGATQELQFGLGTVEVELEVEVTKAAEGKAGVKFWVVNADAKGSRSTVATQRVKLSLLPVSANGDEVKVTSFIPGPIG